MSDMIELGDGITLRPEAVDGVKQHPRAFAQAKPQTTIYLRGGQTVTAYVPATEILELLKEARPPREPRTDILPC